MIHSSKAHSTTDQANEYLAGWQRARAELDNFRKRMQVSQGTQREQAKQELVSSLILLADNFQAMTNHVPAELTDHSWTQGVIHVARQLDQILVDYGVTTITKAKKFDPTKHEAVEQKADKSVQSGTVLEVLQTGYMMGDNVIRPAKVKVAK